MQTLDTLEIQQVAGGQDSQRICRNDKYYVDLIRDHRPVSQQMSDVTADQITAVRSVLQPNGCTQWDWSRHGNINSDD
ncbi:hypothetical protein [Chitinimonas sp. BJB300]|uniref:hypothetical protein n=1 Tax=Chitinimonas sp. BJB300 TaxID=1559339 RepID=UPI000C0E218C|nr:hypothetical protein [Chitinimonas sp. BJB300]PHV09939.1 hypothetical protein CSQ89_18905 [Chitinimonas sp. BJB300]TSJ82519.1 hypothetical protein FG002_022220 [Chitinimonas sp. BJB300]